MNPKTLGVPTSRWPESAGTTGWQKRQDQDPLLGAFSAAPHPAARHSPRADIPQRGEHGEVLVDLQRGCVQQRVDVPQALQPSLQVLPLMAFQSPQLLWGQPGKASRGHGHWWEG